jgi:hypothetical protein
VTPMSHTAVIALAVPSVLERYGVGWDEERSRSYANRPGNPG